MLKQAAETYINGQHTEPTATEMMWFRAWLETEFKAIQHCVRFTPSEVDPAQLKLRWLNTGELLISSANNDSPWLTATENVRFRAVHDWHHISLGLPFDAEGEYLAFEAAAASAPKAIHWILRSEIWYQAAACIHTGQFQEQKLVKNDVG